MLRVKVAVWLWLGEVESDELCVCEGVCVADAVWEELCVCVWESEALCVDEAVPIVTFSVRDPN